MHNIDSIMTSIALGSILMGLPLLRALADQGGKKVFIRDAKSLSEVTEHQRAILLHLDIGIDLYSIYKIDQHQIYFLRSK